MAGPGLLVSRRLVCLTGASGSGKTTLANQLKRPGLTVLHKDDIGVPDTQEMVRRWGSAEGWQEWATHQWMARIAESGGDVVFEGQTRINYLQEALTNNQLVGKIVLVDCSDTVRRSRLAARGHPDLASEEMMSWARFLRSQAQSYDCEVLDTSDMTASEAAERLLIHINQP